MTTTSKPSRPPSGVRRRHDLRDLSGVCAALGVQPKFLFEERARSPRGCLRCANGFRQAFVSGERDLGELMQAAFKSWLKDRQEDAKRQFGEEGYGELAEANDLEFDEDGRLFVKRRWSGKKAA